MSRESPGRRGPPPLLRVPSAIAARIEAQARDAGGVEICGLLAGRGERVTRHYPARNVAGDPSRRFEMDPRAQIAAMREMRERGLDLLAIYHSHPDGSPRPSATDLALHAYPEALCLVVVAARPGGIQWSAHAIEDGSFREVTIVVDRARPPAVDSGGADSGQST